MRGGVVIPFNYIVQVEDREGKGGIKVSDRGGDEDRWDRGEGGGVIPLHYISSYHAVAAVRVGNKESPWNII